MNIMQFEIEIKMRFKVAKQYLIICVAVCIGKYYTNFPYISWTYII